MNFEPKAEGKHQKTKGHVICKNILIISTSLRAVSGLTSWIDCFERARLAGTVFAGGVNEAGEIKSHPALQTAHEMGRNV